jgi:Tol biopolymer transport system component
MSANGRYIEFESASSNLVRGDTNGFGDVFVHDAVTHKTTRVNISSNGAQANGETAAGAEGIRTWTVSNDGRYVVFDSVATNLVPNDNNNADDVFVRDTKLGTTTRVDVSTAGAEADRGTTGREDPSAQVSSVLTQIFVTPINQTTTSYSATPDGRFVAFSSDSTNLVPGDTNETTDVFVRDLATGTTTRVSNSSAGAQGDGASNGPVISADARVVAFVSTATNLAPNDTNGTTDVFVHELPVFAPLD